MVIVPAGSTLVFRTVGGDSVDLLNLSDATVEQDCVLDVLVLSEIGATERGLVTVPTAAGLVEVPARLDREQGQLWVQTAHPVRPVQRRLAPRSGLVLPLRGAATLGASVNLLGSGPRVTFHGHTIDVAPGGLQARLVGDLGLRLPQELRTAYVELDPAGPHPVAVALTVVALRSDVLRAQFSFISLADWARLRERARDQSEADSE